jgi:hypothetical protein
MDHGHSRGRVLAKVKFVESYTAEVLAAREALKETNDCTVVSLAVVTGKDYRHARAIMAAGGRLHRKGRWMHKAAAIVGMDMVRGLDGEATPTLAEFSAAHPRGSYWVEVKGHALAVVDGVIYDHSHKPRRRVLRAWRVPS